MFNMEDFMREEAYEAMSRQLYPEHRDQAIEEFTSDRLRSYYLKHPDVAVNGVGALREARLLLEHEHAAAAVVFAVTSIEQCLKAALLKPVVFGLVHIESLAALLVEVAMDQNGGLDRYKKLLEGLFRDLAGIDVATIRRDGQTKGLFEEVKELQVLRNKITHRGLAVEKTDGEHALAVANAVFGQVFIELLAALDLQIIKGAHIVRA